MIPSGNALKACLAEEQQRVEARERELAHWQSEYDAWVKSLRSRYETTITLLSKDSDSHAANGYNRQLLYAWLKVTLQSRIDEARQAAERATKARNARLEDEVGEISETRRAATELESKLRSSVSQLLTLSRTAPRVDPAAGSQTEALHGLFLRLLQLVFGDVETAWLSVCDSRHSRITRERFQLLADRIALGSTVADALWTTLASPSSLNSREVSLGYESLARGPLPRAAGA